MEINNNNNKRRGQCNTQINNEKYFAVAPPERRENILKKNSGCLFEVAFLLKTQLQSQKRQQLSF